MSACLQEFFLTCLIYKGGLTAPSINALLASLVSALESFNLGQFPPNDLSRGFPAPQIKHFNKNKIKIPTEKKFKAKQQFQLSVTKRKKIEMHFVPPQHWIVIDK